MFPGMFLPVLLGTRILSVLFCFSLRLPGICFFIYLFFKLPDDWECILEGSISVMLETNRLCLVSGRPPWASLLCFSAGGSWEAGLKQKDTEELGTFKPGSAVRGWCSDQLSDSQNDSQNKSSKELLGLSGHLSCKFSVTECLTLFNEGQLNWNLQEGRVKASLSAAPFLPPCGCALGQ